MSFRLTDTIFWISAVCCALAQTAILRSVALAPSRADEASPRASRRAIEIAWAVLPGIALVVVFVLTWRAMHGSHIVAPPPSAMR